jgi:hypothetical protein
LDKLFKALVVLTEGIFVFRCLVVLEAARLCVAGVVGAEAKIKGLLPTPDSLSALLLVHGLLFLLLKII